MLYMFDTNVLSEHLKGNTRIVDRAAALGLEDAIAISNIAWFEIIRGRVSSLTTADAADQLLLAQSRLNRDLDGLDRFRIHDVSEAVARQFELLRTNKKIKKIGRNDLLIACIALANKAVLVTRNVKDFANVPGLTLQNWFE